ncbi:ubiquitinyl hydrolase 1 [Malassezia vespertilionis]|uniref:ubiquitinyl hydrolase 1 n=1 Tax=Malassezia vespertilionis TaxID=2020962 RepID=UPI0024B22B7F|nr:ubiquitinyl hydrolase 1 [Malassezia vespertilionis]WFD08090.1 ubiquitinyl hydrolase 1 [Malassezia vespertilionis]
MVQSAPAGMDEAPLDTAVSKQPRVSVMDEKAFSEKYLADLGLDEAEFKVFHWPIKSWSALEKRITSPEFEVGGHRWRILLFPFGNSNGQPYDMVSVYLDYADDKRVPEGWHACAQFALVISNPTDPTLFSTSQAHHRFTAEEMDWGFTRFNESRKLAVPFDARVRPIIEDDQAVVSAYVRVLKDPTGVLWHNFINYDSKKETGYVGMKNQGATCYMNSLLQSLFCINYYRRAVYQIPTENDIPTDSVALALQRVFYNLQTSDQPVGTTELTKSFGWKSLDSFLQHDVQEFNRVLQEKLEAKMKGTASDGAIQELFVGKMKSYLRCVDVDYESSRTEDFYDIQLNVKSMPDLEASFADYIQTEMLEGDNKYFAEGFGLQDARKGVIFEKFPPVLHLQLKRFEYDMERDAMVKINDRHEFPADIDLAPYIDQERQSEPWIYRLHGVLVHSGDLHGGHYFALIKPERDSGWYKFDDDRVTLATEREVFEDNFGGEMPQQRNQPATAPIRAMKRFTNAYMLVYIRESQMDEVLKPFGPQDTPTHLTTRLEDERLQMETRRRELEEQHLYVNVRVVTEDIFRHHQGFDLAAFDDRTGKGEVPCFRVLKYEAFLHFKRRLAQQYGLPEDMFRVWVLVNRQNKTIRPDMVVPDDQTLTVESVRDRMASRQHDLRLYLEVLAPNSLATAFFDPAHPSSTILLFLKHFDTSRQTLLGVTHIYVPRQMKVMDLVPTINELMRWPPTTQVKLVEEIKPGMIEQLKPKATFVQSELQDGDVVCFQIELTDKDTSEYEMQSMCSNPMQFYDFLQNQVHILLKPRFEDVEYKTELELTLSKKMTYDMLAARVAERLTCDPLKLRFTVANGPNGAPKSVLKRTANQTINEIIQSSYLQGPASLLYYELLEVSIIELETKRALKLVWMGAHNKEAAAPLPLLLPKTATVHEVADRLAKSVALEPSGTQKIRIFEVVAFGKQQHELHPSDTVSSIPDGIELFAEELAPEELGAGENEKLVNVCHFYKDPMRTHGVPFKFVLKRGERFADTAKRLLARLQLAEKDAAKFRYALLQLGQYQQPTYLEDDDVLFDHKFQSEDVVAIDHVDLSGRPNRYGNAPSQDRGIRIRS